LSLRTRRYHLIRAPLSSLLYTSAATPEISTLSLHDALPILAALEEDGYITQPHTSAGRIPTDKGYRMFVDSLSEVKPLSAAERRDRKSTRLNSSHVKISYAVFCLKKKKKKWELSSLRDHLS